LKPSSWVNCSLPGFGDILSTGHTHGSITDTMEIVEVERKGKHLNTFEKYHMYRFSSKKDYI
jgi:hypothetical protein